MAEPAVARDVTGDDVEYMLTTVDNPYDPFTEWNEWLAWDTLHRHNTLGLLARVTVGSDALSDADQLIAVQQGIDEVCRENVSGIHRKVSRTDSTSDES